MDFHHESSLGAGKGTVSPEDSVLGDVNKIKILLSKKNGCIISNKSVCYVERLVSKEWKLREISLR